MKAAEIRELSEAELFSKERELRRELWRARFDNFSNQLDDTAKIKHLRRDIARVKTILVERTNGAANE